MERIGGGYRKIVQPACTGIEKKNSPLDKVSGYSFLKTLLCLYHAPGPSIAFPYLANWYFVVDHKFDQNFKNLQQGYRVYTRGRLFHVVAHVTSPNRKKRLVLKLGACFSLGKQLRCLDS
jgi:hypothetical protein